jgi:type IV pilus assembly protein PilW
MRNHPKGFTLIELLVAMVVGLILTTLIYKTASNHQRTHVTQQLVVDMEQNARAAVALMKREIRMMGYDPAAMDGVDNDLNATIDDESSGAGIVIAEGDSIQFTADFNYNWTLDPGNEDVTYDLAGSDLQRNGDIVAYDVEAVGFAYAFDDDGDGELDESAGGNIIWAIDANAGDNKLDTRLDTNDDGVIDENDTEGGANMAGQVDNDRIRAVRIWLLAQTRQPIWGHTDNQTYVVGATHKGPAEPDWDSRKRRVLLSVTVHCRNMGT